MPRRDIITGRIIEDEPKAQAPMPSAPTKETIAESITELEQEVPREIIEEDSNTKWTALMVDSQELSSFMSCPRKYDYGFNQHLVPVGGMAKGMDRGTIVHNGLLEYWKVMIKNNDYQEATKNCIRRAKEELEKDIKFNSDDKLEILQTILDFLKHIQANSWVPLEVEKYFRVKAYEDPKLRLRIYLHGRIDLIVRTPQIPVLPIDFKTESERWFYSQLSNQFRIYAIACGTNLVGIQRVGFQKTLEPKDKFKLDLLPFDQDVIDEFRNELLPYWAKQMLMCHEENYYPMNTSSCIKGHFKCQYSDGVNNGICNVSRSVRGQKLNRYFIRGEAWDPSKHE